MTTTERHTSKRPRRRRSKAATETLRAGHGDRWQLRDAKAHLSEVVRRAQTEGPQRVTVRGREDVFIIRSSDLQRLKGSPTGQALIDVLKNAPLKDIPIEPVSMPMPVRDVEL